MARALSVLSKEVDTIHWIDGFEERTVFWDVGANVGVYSLYAAIQKRVSVLAFEPSAANFHVLSRNVHLNQLGDRATAYCIAFSERSQLGMLNMASPSIGAAVSQFGRSGEMSRYWDGQTVAASHGMIGFAIDDFIVQFNPPFPNYLKIDVAGLEPQILQGARTTLRDTRLRSLLVELMLNMRARIGALCHFLRTLDFVLFQMVQPRVPVENWQRTTSFRGVHLQLQAI